MYRVSLTGTGEPSAYWPCVSLKDAAEKVHRWRAAVGRLDVAAQPLPPGWQIVIEEDDGEGQWNTVAQYNGGAGSAHQS